MTSQDEFLNIMSPLFFKGHLAYNKSGHSLTFVNGYYICAKKQKGVHDCKNELNQLAKNIDLKIIKLLNNWHVEPNILHDKIMFLLGKATQNAMRNAIYDSKMKVDRGLAAVEAMRSDYNLKGKINHADITFIKTIYLKLLQINFPVCLLRYAQIAVSDLHHEYKARISVLFKKIYLSNEGEIVSIELEGLGEFALNFIDSIIPNFSERLGIEIIRPLGIKTTDPNEAMTFFQKDNFSSALCHSIFSSQHSIDRHIESLFKYTNGGSAWEICNLSKFILKIHWQLLNTYFGNLQFITKNNFDKLKFNKKRQTKISGEYGELAGLVGSVK